MSSTARRSPGWYDDATDVALLRYWDGSGWTPHTSPRAPPPADAAPAPTHPLEGLGLESTRRLDRVAGVTSRTPEASSPPDHTTVPTPPGAPGPSPAALPTPLGPSPRIWFVAAAGAIMATASLVVAFAALGVALGR